MRSLLTIASVLALLTAGACNQEQTEPAPAAEPEPTPEPVAEAPAEPAPTTEPTTAEELPVAEDFEGEVTAAITPENYASELDALEKELEEAE